MGLSSATAELARRHGSGGRSHLPPSEVKRIAFGRPPAGSDGKREREMNARRSSPPPRRRLLVPLVIALLGVASLGCHRGGSAGSGRSDAELSAARCLGPADARGFAVYLHGVDAERPSAQEIENRRVLDRIAAERSLRIAVPRATRPCPNQPGSICWGWAFDDKEIAAAAGAIDAAARECFGERPFSLLGFSNGGYLLTKMVGTCALRAQVPRAESVLTFGSTMLHGPLPPAPADLRGCGKLVMVVGTGDTYNFDPSGNYLKALLAKGADATEVRFDGGHLVPLEPTRSLLSPTRGASAQ
ncbi:Hypothetical protein A7982_06085 [Minicystis rosea]|nr:Hypothetical protein A7982_06085 [Minicystis rosea]